MTDQQRAERAMRWASEVIVGEGCRTVPTPTFFGWLGLVAECIDTVAIFFRVGRKWYIAEGDTLALAIADAERQHERWLAELDSPAAHAAAAQAVRDAINNGEVW